MNQNGTKEIKWNKQKKMELKIWNIIEKMAQNETKWNGMKKMKRNETSGKNEQKMRKMELN